MQIPNYFKVNEEGIYGFFGNYRFLSNFYMEEVLYDGILYPSSEHAYQAAKTTDEELRSKIQNHPLKGLKKLGYSITLRENWDQIKVQIMREILLDKFSRHVHLKISLNATDPKYLEETNHWGDKFWGVCIKTGVGQNNLGKLLMEVRNELKSA